MKPEYLGEPTGKGLTYAQTRILTCDHLAGRQQQTTVPLFSWRIFLANLTNLYMQFLLFSCNRKDFPGAKYKNSLYSEYILSR